MKDTKFLFGFMLLAILYACTDESTAIRTSLEGAWVCNEYNLTSTSPNRTYLVDFDPTVRDTTTYVLSNFHNVGQEDFITAKLVGDTLTLLPNQIGFSQIMVRSGSGRISANLKQIDLNYNIIVDGQSNQRIHAIFTRP